MDTSTPIKATPFDPNLPVIQKFVRDLNTPWKMKLYFIRKLPSCWFWGVRVKSIDHQNAEVTIPFQWRSQNPFRSTYFAALAGAAELSTGLLCSIALRGRRKVSMLITNAAITYSKKANTTTTFTCNQGLAVIDTIQMALETMEPQTIQMTSIGRNTDGVEVARATFTWSFKVKS
ncbi:MAG: DUF4442 domain-containing protein [Bacteroidota bacterium]